jgi:hypothetical protein
LQKAKGRRPDQFEAKETMNVIESLRKGFGFLLMSFGISSPVKKPKPAAKPASDK